MISKVLRSVVASAVREGVLWGMKELVRLEIDYRYIAFQNVQLMNSLGSLIIVIAFCVIISTIVYMKGC